MSIEQCVSVGGTQGVYNLGSCRYPSTRPQDDWKVIEANHSC